jgi:hypothetical protein
VEEDWLRIETELDAADRAAPLADPDRTWALLRWNRELEGGAKFVRHGREGIALWSELALEGPPSVGRRIALACRGLQEGVHRLKNGGAAPAPAVRTVPCAPAIRELCRAAGWPCQEAQAGAPRVQLEVADGSYFAAIAGQEAGRLRMAAELCRWETGLISASSRWAVALLLLAASGAVRMVRAVVEEEGDMAVARAEFVAPRSVTKADIGHALAGLSVFCGLCGKEVVLLQEEEVAEAYLALSGAPRKEGIVNGKTIARSDKT